MDALFRERERLFAIIRDAEALIARIESKLTAEFLERMPPQLSQREREVLKMICEGKPNKVIAYDLHITIRTVKFHVTALFRKLKVDSRLDLARIGLRSAIALLFFFLPAIAHATTYTAASCAESAFQTEVNLTSNGDTVQGPVAGGSATWGNNTVGDVTLSIATGITLNLNGCHITDNIIHGDSGCANIVPMITVSLTSNIPVRVTGAGNGGRITGANHTYFNCGESAEHILVQGTNQARVDNIVFDLMVTGVNFFNAYGVIDHNTFNEPTSGQCMYLSNCSVFPTHAALNSLGGIGQYGDNSWAQPDTFGMANAVYVETNTFNFTNLSFPVGCSDEEFGARIVFRFNIGCPFWGMHGLDSSGRARSGRQYEIYDNPFVSLATSVPIPNMYTGITLRGGTGFIFTNTFTDTGLATYTTQAQLNSFRSTNGIYLPWGQGGGSEGCDGTGPWDNNSGTTYATGTVASSSTNQIMTASGSPGWTTNQWAPSGGTVYMLVDTTLAWGSIILSNTAGTITVQAPQQISASLSGQFNAGDSFKILQVINCLDQIGRGEGSYLSGNPATPTGWPSEVSDPLYEFANSYDGTPQPIITSNNANLQANRDFYDWTSTFNGTSGTGSGVLSSRPSTCTVGVGYWATDQGSWNQSGSGGQGQFYKCTATNTWTLSYTPYIYPHPLVSGSVTLLPASQNFGTINVGFSSAPVVFTLTNNSASTASSIAPSTTGGNPGDFLIVNHGAGSCQAASGSLVSGASCTFSVQFSPLAAGARSTTLSVSYSGGDGASPQTSALSGNGQAPAAAGWIFQ